MEHFCHMTQFLTQFSHVKYPNPHTPRVRNMTFDFFLIPKKRKKSTGYIKEIVNKRRNKIKVLEHHKIFVLLQFLIYYSMYVGSIALMRLDFWHFLQSARNINGEKHKWKKNKGFVANHLCRWTFRITFTATSKYSPNMFYNVKKTIVQRSKKS